MIFTTRAVAAAFLLVGTAGICAAQTAGPAPANPSFDELVGHKLTAIDGSSISLNSADGGGLAREIVTTSGAVQRTYFTFINDKLGTVADAADARKITGVFRRSGTGIQIDYADGSTEKLAINPGGGLTVQKVSADSTSCVSWYPEGHKFTLEERKAALSAFAVKLGLADAATNAPKSDCEPTVAADAKPAPAPAAAPVVPNRIGVGALASGGNVPAAVGSAAGASLPATAGVAAQTQAIEVRNSEIHLIDPAPAADAKPADAKPADAKPADAKPQVVASATPPDLLSPDQHGASACLSVESDGSHWGFRNHCGYTVQFAYCLMGNGQLVSCRDGAVAGSVAGNGFGALVADESLKETDAKHDFRWVACRGGAGEVIPHLDQIDPPSGRCVR